MKKSNFKVKMATLASYEKSVDTQTGKLFFYNEKSFKQKLVLINDAETKVLTIDDEAVFEIIPRNKFGQIEGSKIKNISLNKEYAIFLEDYSFNKTNTTRMIIRNFKLKRLVKKSNVIWQQKSSR